MMLKVIHHGHRHVKHMHSIGLYLSKPNLCSPPKLIWSLAIIFPHYLNCKSFCGIRSKLRMRGGLRILKLVRKRLIETLQLWLRMSCSTVDVERDEDIQFQQNNPPEDVKEGHFVVHAVDDGELKRFIIALSYLSRPDFLSLLEQAEAEFGFTQEGVLTVPCKHRDIERILECRG